MQNFYIIYNFCLFLHKFFILLTNLYIPLQLIILLIIILYCLKILDIKIKIKKYLLFNSK
jgi:hypothetical protein